MWNVLKPDETLCGRDKQGQLKSSVMSPWCEHCNGNNLLLLIEERILVEILTLPVLTKSLGDQNNF